MLIPVSSADISDLIPSAGAQMIHDGIMFTLVSIGDSCMDAGFEINNVTSGDASNSTTMNAVFGVATWTYDPYENEGIRDIIKLVMSVWLILTIIQILAGITWVNIHDTHPNAAESLSFIAGINHNSTFNNYMTGIKDNIFITMFSYIGIYLILSLNLVFTNMIMFSMLDVIAPTPDNIMLYTMMGFTYLVMAFFFLIRFLVINIFAAFAPILGVMYGSNYFTRAIAVKSFIFFCAMVFMQTVIVFFTSVGLIAINGMGFGFASRPGPYIALCILLVIIAVVMMVGWAFIRRSSRTVINLVA